MLWNESDIHIERILTNEQFWLDQVSRVKNFFTTCILPELLGKFYSRTDDSKVIYTDKDPCCSVTSDITDGENGSSESNKKWYCYCQVPDGDDMVGCDSQACEWEWFHLKRLKLKDFPSKKHWYHPNCRKLPQFKYKGKNRKC